MKSLVLVPIIHTAADLGSLAGAVKSHYLRELGTTGWQKRERLVATMWDEVRKRVAALRLDGPRVRIYQDGLPVCGHELQIVQELARAGSLNHQLVLELVDRGAMLMGTEDPQLLIREYQMHRRQMSAPPSPNAGQDSPPQTAAELLEARDRFIAGRISETLQDGELALVFLGAAHRLDTSGFADVEIRALAS